MDVALISIIFTAAIIIGVFAVVFGGTLFLSLPLFQILFPEMSLAALVGNIKLGSIVRNGAALVPLRQHLSREVIPLAIVLCIGSVGGALFATSASATWIPFVLILGWLVSEYAEAIVLPRNLRWLLAFLVGIYGGVLGAGILLLIIALLQLQQTTLLHARANAVALELAISFVAVGVFLQFNLIDWPIALTWAAGGILGGYLGGVILNRTGKLQSSSQRWLLRVAFMLALVVAVLSIS